MHQKIASTLSSLKAQSPKRIALVSTLVVAMALSAIAAPKIYADNFQDQINQLQAENDQNQSSVDALLLDAKSYQEAISKLQDEISVVQQNIATNQSRQTDLQHEIAAKQAELDIQRKVLGDDIRAMYVNGQLSALEMLATSKNLNDFVDSSTYRTAVQNKIQSTLSQIAKLQNQLQEQKVQVDALLTSQRAQQDQLDSDQKKQADLLAYNQTQQSAYNQLITANQDKIRDLQLKQAALNQQGASRVTITGNERGGDCDGGSGNGGYVLASSTQGDVCNAPKDAILDWAGIQNRECTSYAYWYFKQVEGNKDFTASGDAKYWVDTSNYPVHDWPQVGALGVKTEGQWGHVTIVQAVGPSSYKGVQVPAGQVLTSEMNSEYTGKFSYNLRGIGTLHYIYK